MPFLWLVLFAVVGDDLEAPDGWPAEEIGAVYDPAGEFA